MGAGASVADRPPCRHAEDCRNYFCAFGHSDAWRARRCPEGQACVFTDCGFSIHPRRRQDCHAGEACQRADCHFLHPRAWPLRGEGAAPAAGGPPHGAAQDQPAAAQGEGAAEPQEEARMQLSAETVAAVACSGNVPHRSLVLTSFQTGSGQNFFFIYRSDINYHICCHNYCFFV